MSATAPKSGSPLFSQLFRSSTRHRDQCLILLASSILSGCLLRAVRSPLLTLQSPLNTIDVSRLFVFPARTGTWWEKRHPTALEPFPPCATVAPDCVENDATDGMSDRPCLHLICAEPDESNDGCRSSTEHHCLPTLASLVDCLNKPGPAGRCPPTCLFRKGCLGEVSSHARVAVPQPQERPFPSPYLTLILIQWPAGLEVRNHSASRRGTLLCFNVRPVESVKLVHA